MSDKATEMRNGKGNFYDETNGFVFAGENAEDIEHDEFAAEIKNIFDRLRTVGSPKNHSLDEVLALAVAAEERRANDAAVTIESEIGVRKTSRQVQDVLAAGLKQLHFRELMGSLLLVVMLALIAYLSLIAPVRVDSKSISDEESNSRINLR